MLLFPQKNEVDDIAMNILQKRYFAEGESKWEDVVARVIDYVIKDDKDDTKNATYQMILNRYFIPNSPTLVNAGKKGSGLSACFVVDFNDSIEEIYKTKLDFALIARKGGGCGTTLSKLRPMNAKVNGSTHGYAGGPVKFFDSICHDMEVLTQSGFREMAMMGVMSVYHPDIKQFITAKTEEGRMRTTNISVMVDNTFMEKVERGETYWTEFNGKKYEELDAREVFDMIVDGAWKNGEPGILFYDKINDSPYKYSNQEILATNPCVVGDTEINTVEGRIKIKDLVGKEIDVYTMDESGNLAISKAKNIRKTRENAELISIETSREALLCTPDHLIYTSNRGYVRADELELTDKLVGLNRKMNNEQQVYIALTGGKYRAEHRFIAGHYWNIKGKDVHHLDGNHLNNTKSNFQVLSHGMHSIVTNLGHEDWNDHGADGKFTKKAKTKKKDVYRLNGNPKGVRLTLKSITNHSINEDVYDMEVENTHNFIANGIVIHNCGEQPLPPNGVCNLGSFDISKFLDEENELDYLLLELAVRLAVRFLDNVITVNDFPTEAIDKWAKENRPIGIGIMGLADYFLKKEIVYGSEKSLKETESILGFIYNVAEDESITLGEEFGVPEACKNLPKPRRNVTLLTVAPTGTISLLAGCSSGIEPIFSEVTVRKDNTGTYNMIHPDADKEYFRCAVSSNGAEEVSWEEHILLQNSAQRFVDSGVSKTINFPLLTRKQTVYNAFMLAWKLDYIKGLTVYRNGSRVKEVLTPKNLKKDKCPICGEELIRESGCKHCISCDFSLCEIS